jgi:hypothetical protein
VHLLKRENRDIQMEFKFAPVGWRFAAMTVFDALYKASDLLHKLADRLYCAAD